MEFEESDLKCVPRNCVQLTVNKIAITRAIFLLEIFTQLKCDAIGTIICIKYVLHDEIRKDHH